MGGRCPYLYEWNHRLPCCHRSRSCYQSGHGCCIDILLAHVVYRNYVVTKIYSKIVADIGMEKGQKQDLEYRLHPFLYFH